MKLIIRISALTLVIAAAFAGNYSTRTSAVAANMPSRHIATASISGRGDSPAAASEAAQPK